MGGSFLWICGGLAAGAFIKMVLGICSDGPVVGVVVLVAVDLNAI